MNHFINIKRIESPTHAYFSFTVIRLMVAVWLTRDSKRFHLYFIVPYDVLLMMFSACHRLIGLTCSVIVVIMFVLDWNKRVPHTI